MTNQQLIERIEKHQKDQRFHPLTCGRNSGHELLKAIERNGKVVLKCPDCEYIQEFIPYIP